MRLALAVFGFHLPIFLKKKMLVELSNLTARSFSVPSPNLKGLSYGRMLEAYALFTKQEAAKLSEESAEEQAVKARLHREARELGQRLRTRFRLQNPEDVFLLSRLLYQALGIDFEGRPDGAVIIRRCFFSRFYKPAVCRVISSLDEGTASGLSGGGRLDFYQRITEGYDCCRARFVFEEEAK
jgi:hypothetical protein